MKTLILIIATACFSGCAAANTTIDSVKSVNKTIELSAKADSLKTDASKIYINIQGEKKPWYSDWLPFIATIIVAYVAYRGVIKQSKASSVSGFRVNWIEDLRVSYGKFLIALRNVDNKIRKGEIDFRRYSKDEDLEQVLFLKTKINLLLNHNEDEHLAFWEALSKYMEDHRAYYKGEFSEDAENVLDTKRIALEQLLLVIFKKEWEKAKNFG